MESSNLPATAERFLNHLQAERGLSKNSLLAYRSDLRKFFELEPSFTEEGYDRFLIHLHKLGLSPLSIARAISALRGYSKFLRRTDSEIFLVPHQRKLLAKRLPKALTLARVTSLIEGCREDVNGLRDRAIIELFYSAGLRVSELVGLEVADFRTRERESSARFIRVLGKGSKERLVPVGGYAVVAIEKYLVRSRPVLRASKTTSALFLNHHGERLTRQGIWHMLQEASKRAGLEEAVSPHQLRHSFATHLLENGADVRSVQELLGHANVTTTQIYTMVTRDALREVFSESHPRAR
ncbi:MAG: tyrosine recombinase [Actinomycetota bacterium]